MKKIVNLFLTVALVITMLLSLTATVFAEEEPGGIQPGDWITIETDSPEPENEFYLVVDTIDNLGNSQNEQEIDEPIGDYEGANVRDDEGDSWIEKLYIKNYNLDDSHDEILIERTFEIHVGEVISKVDASKIPNVLKEQAKQDYPKLFSDSTGFTLSQGNIIIICSVAGLVVIGLVVILVVRKKKPSKSNNGDV